MYNLRDVNRIALFRVRPANTRPIPVESSRSLLAQPVSDVRRLSTAVTRQVLHPSRSDAVQKRLLSVSSSNKLCGRPPQYAPAPCKLTFDLLTLKVVSEYDLGYTSVPILVFLCLSVLDLGPMYATDVRRQRDRRQTRIIA